MITIKNLKGDLLVDWHRDQTKNGVPYYKNCRLETSQWYHPDYVLLLQGVIQRFRGTRYTAYRMAQKLAHIRDTLGVTSVNLQTMVAAFASVGLTSSDCNDDQISVAVTEALLENLFVLPESENNSSYRRRGAVQSKRLKQLHSDDKLKAGGVSGPKKPCKCESRRTSCSAKEASQKQLHDKKYCNVCANSFEEIDKSVSVELLLNLLLNLFDQGRSGVVPVLGCKLVLCVLCGADVSLQRTQAFLAAQLTGNEGQISRGTLHRALLLLARLPELLGEELWFGRQLVDATVSTAFQPQADVRSLTSTSLCAWLHQEPQTLVWWSTLYRLTYASTVEHAGVQCSACSADSPTGLLYVCRQCPGYALCQLCFFTARCSAPHSPDHAVQEHCQQVGLRERGAAALDRVAAKLRLSSRSSATQRFLPLPGHATTVSGREHKIRPDPTTPAPSGAVRQSPACAATTSSMPTRTVSPAPPGGDAWSVSIVPDDHCSTEDACESPNDVNGYRKINDDFDCDPVKNLERKISEGIHASDDDEVEALKKIDRGVAKDKNEEYEKINDTVRNISEDPMERKLVTVQSSLMSRQPLKPLNPTEVQEAFSDHRLPNFLHPGAENVPNKGKKSKKSKKSLLNRLFKGPRSNKCYQMNCTTKDDIKLQSKPGDSPSPFVRNDTRSRSLNVNPENPNHGVASGNQNLYGRFRYGSCRMNPAYTAAGRTIKVQDDAGRIPVADKALACLDETLLRMERQNSTNRCQQQLQLHGSSKTHISAGDSPRRQLASVISQLQGGYCALSNTSLRGANSAAVVQQHTRSLAQHIAALRSVLQKMNGPVGVVTPCVRSTLERQRHERVPSFESSTPISGAPLRPRMPTKNFDLAPPKTTYIPRGSPGPREPMNSNVGQQQRPASSTDKLQVAPNRKMKTTSWSALSPIVHSGCDSARRLDDTAIVMKKLGEQEKAQALGIVEADRGSLAHEAPRDLRSTEDSGAPEECRLPSFTEVSFSDLTRTGSDRVFRTWGGSGRSCTRDVYSVDCDAVLSASDGLATLVGDQATLVGGQATVTDRDSVSGKYDSLRSNNGSNCDNKNAFTAPLSRVVASSVSRSSNNTRASVLGNLDTTSGVSISGSNSMSTSLDMSCEQLQLELEDILQQLDAMFPAGGLSSDSECDGVVVAAQELGDCLAEYVNAVPSQDQ
ncbi:uncharacterized protein LOC108679752 isoform X2 [Hyalella azteca]|uniref:Uncharacterized protein LOC108679752 isoform X2 n=1 Tax=Hyalella azteca TaxID=294128 RepID=A0A979FQ94_HYAAZ|nr:uncharacterized protein LOC108679752 isoform X2 [Hyalella azteca]